MQMISTIPRSGTWFTKYLLVFIYRISSGMSVDIKDVFPHVLELAPLYVDGAKIEEFRRAGLTGNLPFVQVSHYICPGFFAQDDDVVKRVRETLQKVDALDWHLSAEYATRDCAPVNGGRVSFIYRHPFDVFLSYARLFNDREAITEKKAYPRYSGATRFSDVARSS